MGADHHGYSFIITSPAFERILKQINPAFEYETKTLLRKDSLDLTDEDRNLILRACEHSPIDKIVITHGTDTMVQTAKLLSRVKDKTIVITGAMSPELFKNSDADFNLGVAVGAATIIESGVYISMSGLVLRWDEASFDSSTGQFKNMLNHSKI